jgi:hypothetical protein
MNPKINAPFHAPQILLDQFQRPVAPIPGATMLDTFALHIFCSLVSKFDKLTEEQQSAWVTESVDHARALLDELYKAQSESNIAAAQVISISNEQ